MEIALIVVGLVATVVIGAQLAEKIGIPSPLVLLVLGIIGSALPFIPEVPLTPDLVLLGLLPPLLYAAAQGTSIADISAYRAPILSLSVALVVITAFGVGIVAYWILPISFALAVALGAIVAPPDAVAATAVARRIGLPRRLTIILEGESLFNDATALVTLSTALAVAGYAAHGEVPEVTVLSVAINFTWAVVGGIGIGILVAVVVGWARRRIHSSSADTALSWIVPFLAFLPAEEVRASGVFAVVTAGLLLAHKAPYVQTAQSRISERTNWSSITFVLENAVFLLIGLQLAYIVNDVRAGSYSLMATLIAGLVVLAVVMLIRPLWMIPYTRWVRRHEWSGSRSQWGATIVASWAGMRGVVTLAAAMTVPESVPFRNVLIMIALIVTVGTLMIQGLTLPRMARWLDVRGPDPREDALQQATVVQAAAAAGLRALEGDETIDDATRATLTQQAEDRVNRVWETLNIIDTQNPTTPSALYRRARLEMIDAERKKLLIVRGKGTVDQPIISESLAILDVEESSLRYYERKAERIVGGAPLKAPEQVTRDCEHFQQEPIAHAPIPPLGCEECLNDGVTEWVALRMCLHCGHLGCCDSSRGHARVHYHETNHPVMRSVEPGELWRWCYVHDTLG